jgi:hypothetical protein
MKKIIIILIIIVFTAIPALAGITNVTSTGISGSGFPVALSTAGETYKLTENIVCQTTCFSIKAQGITIDLNGFTAIFGNANNPNIPDPGFENWADLNTPLSWTVVSGSLTRDTAQVWGNYDAILSPTGSIRSGTVTLKANQTYSYYSIIKGNSLDAYTISIVKASDDTVLASKTITGSYLDRAFGMEDGIIFDAEQSYKPTVDTDVYLAIQATGTYTKRIHIADIKPAKHFFVIANNYLNTSISPDLNASFFGVLPTSLYIISSTGRATIQQGSGNAVKSAAIFNLGKTSLLSNVNINMTGNNTSSVNTATLDLAHDFIINTSSILNFNRMHPTTSFTFGQESTGSSEVYNFEMYNDPEGALTFGWNFLSDTDTHTTKIHDGIIRNKEQVTEGYAIAMTGVANVEIYNMDINPYLGRGILLDSTANRSGYLDGTKNVIIRNNVIRNLYEHITPEYGSTMLEAAGIRVRDWGGTDPPEGHRNLKIHDNIITGYVDSTGTHRVYGINITSSGYTNAEIYNNTIDITVNSRFNSDWQTAAIAFQNANMLAKSGSSILIHHNFLRGSYALMFGGNDGYAAKGISIYSNKIESDQYALFYNNYMTEFDSNSYYCNQITNTGISGYPINITSTPTLMTNQLFDYNLFTNANTSYIYNTTDYSSSILFYGSGVLSVTGGGTIGYSASPTNGSEGCYTSAGVAGGDIFPPSTSATPVGGTYSTSQTVTLSCYDNISCSSTYYCLGAGCTPNILYTVPILISSSNTLRYYSKDAIPNNENIKQDVFVINNDITPPIITTSIQSGRYTSSQTVTLTANETATIKYCTNISGVCIPTIIYSAPFKVLQNVARHYYCYNGTDTSNNTSITECKTLTKQRAK